MKHVKILVILLAATWFLACKKSYKASMLEQYFEENILNRNFAITYAFNEGANLTSVYQGYQFVLAKGADYYHGPMTVTKNGIAYQGKWTSNDDYGKLRIELPGSPVEFIFLTRDWRFTSKNIPTLKFAPWGSSANIALTMERN